MSTITAGAVKSLRDRTGAGMMDCKRALLETGGDEEQAIDLLRQWGSAKAAKRAEREMSEGVVAIAQDESGAGMVAVSSETDFVARNDDFQSFATRLAEAVRSADLPDGEIFAGATILEREGFEDLAGDLASLRATIGENLEVQKAVRVSAPEAGELGSYLHFGGRIGVLIELSGSSADSSGLAKDLAMHVAATNPMGVSPEDIPAEDRERERAFLVEQAKAEGKPEQIAEKIVEGRMRKYFEENTLLKQSFVKDPDTRIEDLVASHGSDVSVRRFVRFAIGG
ncbi:MAG: translation elongation factor Ts [Candidatus Palauibacterales bacterium]|nr:translation elongation factor Ts [Candidatus Palauibacterales bacterium]MDP2482274.1 translation elongation factor Ts [Candidatus Palauibacterales bacterium]